MKSPKHINLICAALLVFSCSAMFGEFISNKAMKGLGLASQIAPYTKVFGLAHSSENQTPFETFASEFTLHFTTEDGTPSSLKITPESYSRLKGPYNRRNVYGAILAYGPALPSELLTNGLEQALTSNNSITSELGIPEGSSNFSLTITAKNPQLSNSRFTLQP